MLFRLPSDPSFVISPGACYEELEPGQLAAALAPTPHKGFVW